MKKIVYISIGLLFIIFAIALIIFLINKDRINDQKKINEAYEATIKNDPLVKYPKTIPTDSGNINLENIYKNRLNILSEDAFHFRDNETYTMTYFPKEQFFNIVINIEDFERGRQLAGEDFLNLIGGDKEKTCSLNVLISTPSSVNPDYAGVKFDFAFCE